MACRGCCHEKQRGKSNLYATPDNTLSANKLRSTENWIPRGKSFSFLQPFICQSKNIHIAWCIIRFHKHVAHRSPFVLSFIHSPPEENQQWLLPFHFTTHNSHSSLHTMMPRTLKQEKLKWKYLDVKREKVCSYLSIWFEVIHQHPPPLTPPSRSSPNHLLCIVI